MLLRGVTDTTLRLITVVWILQTDINWCCLYAFVTIRQLLKWVIIGRVSGPLIGGGVIATVGGVIATVGGVIATADRVRLGIESFVFGVKERESIYAVIKVTCETESAQQWWFEPNALSVVSGVTTLRLANFPKKYSVAFMWNSLWLESIW